jgi:hypothetical protein
LRMYAIVRYDRLFEWFRQEAWGGKIVYLRRTW